MKSEWASRNVRSAGAVLLGAALLSGCGGETGPVDTGPETGNVVGSVGLSSGQGVAGARLRLERSGATPLLRQSESDGAFRFDEVEVGSWTLRLSPPSGFELVTPSDTQSSVVVRAGETSTRNFLVREPPPTTGSIRATVQADGSPRSGVQLRLFAEGASSATATATTGSDGAALFASVQPGGREVEVTVPSGFALASGETARKGVNVVAGQQASIAFSLQTASAPTVREIRLVGVSFQPAAVTIARGTTVRWINTENVAHTVTPDGHSEWNRWATTQANQTFEHTFDTAGTYAYYCEPHRGLGMTGTITVQ